MDSTIDEMVGMSQYAKNILQTGNKTNSVHTCRSQWVAFEVYMYLPNKFYPCHLNTHNSFCEGYTLEINNHMLFFYFEYGRTHGAPFSGYGYVPLRNGGTSLREWEHNTTTQFYFKFWIVLAYFRPCTCRICIKWPSNHDFFRCVWIKIYRQATEHSYY